MLDMKENIKQPYRLLRNYRLRLRSILRRRNTSAEYHGFQCNICGKISYSPLADIKARETPSCYHCGSTLRFRSIIAALSDRLYGKIIPLTDFPLDHSMRGIGMSDAALYARRLEHTFDYTNTFYHKSPHLDIISPAPEWYDTADFVIASDVFEHVPPPVSAAFNNLFQLSKRHGFIVFSVPLISNGDTIEHFPELHDYKITRRGRERILVNTTVDGRTQIFDQLRFHGGCGATLEMRVFSRNSLLEEISRAGFDDIVIHGTSLPEYGILQDEAKSPVISMRKP